MDVMRGCLRVVGDSMLDGGSKKDGEYNITCEPGYKCVSPFWLDLAGVRMRTMGKRHGASEVGACCSILEPSQGITSQTHQATSEQNPAIRPLRVLAARYGPIAVVRGPLRAPVAY